MDSKRKIVLVEDDVMLAEIYQVRLELAGYDCKAAHDGATGLKLIESVLPDLVLLDLMLPELSGDQVLKAVRASEWGKDLKIVMLTNISEAEAPIELKSLGLERYIVKVNLVHNQLAEIVNSVLQKES